MVLTNYRRETRRVGSPLFSRRNFFEREREREDFPHNARQKQHAKSLDVDGGIGTLASRSRRLNSRRVRESREASTLESLVSNRSRIGLAPKHGASRFLSSWLLPSVCQSWTPPCFRRVRATWGIENESVYIRRAVPGELSVDTYCGIC